MKLTKWLFSKRCANCNSALIDQKVYIARDAVPTGLGALASNEPILYDAVDCPKCGKQTIVGKRYRFYPTDWEVGGNE